MRTGSINPSPMPSASAPIQSRPLPAAAQVANYSAPAHKSPQLASTQTGGVAGWSATGGTPVVVATGETVDTISKRYGVPRDALIHANGFASAAEIKPGTRLVVPVYNASLAASSGAAPATTGRIEKVKFVKGPEPASKADKHLAAQQAAKASKDKKNAQIASTAVVKQADKKIAMKSEPMKSVPPKSVPPKSAPPVVEPHKMVDATPTASLPAASKPAETASASDAANPEFRWPAHGRVIQGFKTGSNDGINIAVPEGTQVKAAEAGVVAYAGSELKGYGNLVLIRHPNGFVTAYANNSDIEVKRGDTVKRGQIIAKSGQSGNVASPQLHFELRKGSTPVDPTQYLAGL
jgi:murein DD-endopeptidase MepM/ murein hydrolase activator NlpD